MAGIPESARNGNFSHLPVFFVFFFCFFIASFNFWFLWTVVHPTATTMILIRCMGRLPIQLVNNWIKQFVVTNCGKERLGSIVTETLKNGILIPIVTSKKLLFNNDFKYTSFIKFSLNHQKLRAWKHLPNFRK